MGGTPLCDQFHYLYRFADPLYSKISDSGFWISGSWVWRINFTESFREEVDSDSMESLLLVLSRKIPLEGSEDSFVWRRNSLGFSVKAAYQMVLEGRVRVSSFDDNLLKVLIGFWKTKIPSKVLIFGWRLLLDRITTKVNLAGRKILVELLLLLCPFCGLEEENSEHLFASFTVFLLWWTKLCDWLRIDSPTFSGNLFDRFCCLESICRTKF